MSSSMAKFEVIDIFCGAGGLSYGLKSSGMLIKCGIDADIAGKYAFEYNTGGKFLHKDIRDLSADELCSYYSKGAIRVLAGCAPCQPFSSYAQTEISKRSNIENKRWNLLGEFQRIAADILPEFITIENVPGLRKKPIWHDFIKFLSQNNYNVSLHNDGVIKCSDIGVPQERKRLVLVASRITQVILTVPNTTPITTRESIAHLPPLKAGETSFKDPLHVCAGMSPLNIKRIKSSIPGGSWRQWPEELKLTCHKRKTGTSYPSVYGRMQWDKPSPTITTQCFGYGNGRFGHPEQDRAISLREAAILQSFPEDYHFFPPGTRLSSLSGIGRLIGNAVPPKLAQWVGESIINSLETTHEKI